MLKVGCSWILLIGPVGFGPTMACSASMVYLTIAELLIQSCFGDILSEPIFGFTGFNQVGVAIEWW